MPCVVCGGLVHERRWSAVCASCWSRVVPVRPLFCPQCRFPAPAIEGPCGRCRPGEHAFDLARSALLFGDTVRRIVHHFKYTGRVSLAKPLARYLERCLEEEPFRVELAVSVPLYPSRVRRHGFNQAALLAERLPLRVDPRILRRRRDTLTQTGLSRAERRRTKPGPLSCESRSVAAWSLWTTSTPRAPRSTKWPEC